MNEALLHEQVCNYLKLRYPKVLFRTDLGGVRLTPGQAARAARMQAGRAWPDLFIPEPHGELHGLFVELKREGTAVYLRNGELTKNPHIREQAAMLDQLNALGYGAVFAVGFEQAKGTIDQYLN